MTFCMLVPHRMQLVSWAQRQTGKFSRLLITNQTLTQWWAQTKGHGSPKIIRNHPLGTLILWGLSSQPHADRKSGVHKTVFSSGQQIIKYPVLDQFYRHPCVHKNTWILFKNKFLLFTSLKVSPVFPLSIVMTCCSTILALGMMPLLLYLYCQGFPNLHHSVPFVDIIISLFMILIPCGAGILFNYYRPQYAQIFKKVSAGSRSG